MQCTEMAIFKAEFFACSIYRVRNKGWGQVEGTPARWARVEVPKGEAGA